jgi:hypothetical protein
VNSFSLGATWTYTAHHSGILVLVAIASAILVAVIKMLKEGSRKYDGNVGEEYDAWTREGILEYYWGEHIHLGYYSTDERRPGFFAWGKKDFKQVCHLPVTVSFAVLFLDVSIVSLVSHELAAGSQLDEVFVLVVHAAQIAAPAV